MQPLAAVTLLAATFDLPARQDNTLYELSTGATSNGGGDHMFAGRPCD